MTSRLAAGAAVAAGALALAAPALGGTFAPFTTSQPAQLTTVLPGATYSPIITSGDTLPNGSQFSGTPDGLGAWKYGRVGRVIVNHELSLNTPQSAQVSELRVDLATRAVRAYRRVVGSTRNFARFCSGSLTVSNGDGTLNAEGFRRTYWFTGEEQANGRALMVNPNSKALATYKVIKGLGLGPWENIQPLAGYGKPVLLAGEDGGQAGTFGSGSPTFGAKNYSDNRSQLWLYVAPSERALANDQGRLYLLTGATPGDTAGKPDDAKVSKTAPLTLNWTPVGREFADRAVLSDPYEMDRLAEQLGAFTFVRIEDTTQVPGSRTVYLADTGGRGLGGTVKGRVYKLEMGSTPAAPVTLQVVLDGDAGDDVVNPDNLAATRKGLVIQEDRNSEHRGAEVSTGYSRLLWWPFAGQPATVAYPSTDAVNAKGIAVKPGEWESSGAIPVGGIFGSDTWLVDIQAHTRSVAQDGGMGEGGQVGLLTIPGSQ